LGVDDGEAIFVKEVEPEVSVFSEVSLEAVHHILILELLIRGVVVDDGKEGHFIAEEADDEIVGGRVDVSDFLLQSILLQNYHFILKDVSVVLFEQFLIGEVYAQLLQGVVSKVLKPKNIEKVDGGQVVLSSEVEGQLHLVDDELKDRIVEGLGQGVSVPQTAISAVGLVCYFL